MLSVAQLDERIDKCLAILSDDPHSQVFSALADAYRKRGDFGRAFAVCKSGLKHHPDYAPAHIVMAKLYVHQSMLDEAGESLSRAQAIEGSTRVAEQLQAEIAIVRHDLSAARQLVDRMKWADPGNPAIPDLESQLRQASRVALTPTASGPVARPGRAHKTTPPESASHTARISWDAWASHLIGQKQMASVFALALSESGHHAESIIVEKSVSQAVGNLANYSALFAAIDSLMQLRAGESVRELRIERPDGEIWYRRAAGFLIGFTCRPPAPFGSLRQKTLDLLSQVEGITGQASNSVGTE